MARTQAIPDSVLLEAARSVFLEHGIRATTLEVAVRAGVSEGLLFRRFHSKQQLFQAAMGINESAAMNPLFLTLMERLKTPTIELALSGLLSDLLAFFRQHTPLWMMTWSNVENDEHPFSEMKTPPPIASLNALGAYLAAEAKAKRLTLQDPQLAARMLAGTLQSTVTLEILLNRPHSEAQTKTLVAQLTNLFLAGYAGRKAGRASLKKTKPSISERSTAHTTAKRASTRLRPTK